MYATAPTPSSISLLSVVTDTVLKTVVFAKNVTFDGVTVQPSPLARRSEDKWMITFCNGTNDSFTSKLSAPFSRVTWRAVGTTKVPLSVSYVKCFLGPVV